MEIREDLLLKDKNQMKKSISQYNKLWEKIELE